MYVGQIADGSGSKYEVIITALKCFKPIVKQPPNCKSSHMPKTGQSSVNAKQNVSRSFVMGI